METNTAQEMQVFSIKDELKLKRHKTIARKFINEFIIPTLRKEFDKNSLEDVLFVCFTSKLKNNITEYFCYANSGRIDDIPTLPLNSSVLKLATEMAKEYGIDAIIEETEMSSWIKDYRFSVRLNS